MGDIEVLITEFETKRDETEKGIKGALKDFFKSIFSDNPSIKSIQWAQYAPYFNDGDACVFHAWDCQIFTGENKEEDFNDEGGITEYGDEPLAKVAEKINKLLGRSEPFLEHLFGDSVRVVVTSDKITTEEYEHD